MSTVYLQPRNPVGKLKKLDFPYTPQIEYGQEVKYDSYAMSHTNYQTYGYGRTENPSINMTCKFSAHTSEHFNLSAYAIRFLRTYTKMNYGRTDPLRGLPPRILRFFAYGNQVFDNVPVGSSPNASTIAKTPRLIAPATASINALSFKFFLASPKYFLDKRLATRSLDPSTSPAIL